MRYCALMSPTGVEEDTYRYQRRIHFGGGKEKRPIKKGLTEGKEGEERQNSRKKQKKEKTGPQQGARWKPFF